MADNRNDIDAAPDDERDHSSSSDADATASTVEALAAVHDEPDEPENPDEKTRAGIEAARASLAPRGVHRRKYRGPRSILIMLFVLGLIITVGVWATSWAFKYVETNQRGELRALEERDTMSAAQQRLTQLKNLGPDVTAAGYIYPPLSPSEKANLAALKQRFGSVFKPNVKQQELLAELKLYEEERGAGAGTQPAK